MANAPPVVIWQESRGLHRARRNSERGAAPPQHIVIADDRITVDAAYRLACKGTAMLWRGDFQNARLLLQAMARRAGGKKLRAAASVTETFHLNRQAQAQRARILGMLLPFDQDYTIPLRRVPEVREACMEAYGQNATGGAFGASLRELLGVIGAHEWRRKGIAVAAAGGRIHPHYGVFAPVRSEYVGLVAAAPLPSPVPALAFDIGTGTGVLAAVFARRGIARVVATDHDPRSLACARENIDRLGLAGQVEVVEADLFPEGRAPLIVCNPPWIPAQPGSILERTEVRPDHPRTKDADDPLHAARAAEMTSLWRLSV